MAASGISKHPVSQPVGQSVSHWTMMERINAHHGRLGKEWGWRWKIRSSHAHQAFPSNPFFNGSSIEKQKSNSPTMDATPHHHPPQPFSPSETRLHSLPPWTGRTFCLWAMDGIRLGGVLGRDKLYRTESRVGRVVSCRGNWELIRFVSRAMIWALRGLERGVQCDKLNKLVRCK